MSIDPKIIKNLGGEGVSCVVILFHFISKLCILIYLKLKISYFGIFDAVSMGFKFNLEIVKMSGISADDRVAAFLPTSSVFLE